MCTLCKFRLTTGMFSILPVFGFCSQFFVTVLFLFEHFADSWGFLVEEKNGTRCLWLPLPSQQTRSQSVIWFHLTHGLLLWLSPDSASESFLTSHCGQLYQPTGGAAAKSCKSSLLLQMFPGQGRLDSRASRLRLPHSLLRPL